MNKLLLSAVVIIAIVGNVESAIAQRSIKILTPTSDSCAAFVQALETNQEPILLTLAGWATGYLSGVAQGTGIDFLRSVEPGNTSVILRLVKECQRQPRERLSVVLENMSREMIAEHAAKP